MLADWRGAGLTPQLEAMLAFLEVMTLNPDSLGPSHVDAALAAGVTKEAVAEAAHVCALFCTITRLADVFQWDVPTDWSGSRESLVKFGYRLPPLL